MTAPATVPQGLTIREAADVLRVHHRTIRKWIAAGRLTVRRIGPRSVRIDAEDLRAFWDGARETAGPAEIPSPVRRTRATTGNPVEQAILARRHQRRGSD